ncbi:MAG TPA: RHS repeat-associated core domain-containing protein, partial [Nitrososphaera sp.]|nr:RHS repeat-associated core domain-containing protein [Nitrososphaera sp.]
NSSRPTALSNRPVPCEDGAGGREYLTADHLGSTRVVTTSNQAVLSRHDYEPCGEEVGSSFGGRALIAGYGGSDATRQRFTSKERDIESGLDYFGARYYSSAQGRFTSVDPENAGADPDDPQSWNAYAYVRNNPLIYVDPTGEDYRLYDEKGNLLGQVRDVKELEKLGYQAYGGNDDGSLLYFKDGDGNLFTAQFLEGEPAKPIDVHAFSDLSPFANGVIRELGRRSDASLTAIYIAGAVNLAPAILVAGSQVAGAGPAIYAITKLAVQKLPSLAGLTKSQARRLLQQAGFKFKGYTKGGYEKWYHPDGSKVQIRPNGEVVRSKGWQRFGPDGRQTPSHNTGETILPN